MTFGGAVQSDWVVTVTVAPRVTGGSMWPPTSRSELAVCRPVTTSRRVSFSHGVTEP